MKAYGRPRKAGPSPDLELGEVSLLATPESLRALARFLAESADQMEQHGPDFGHNHLRDSAHGWQQDWADFIVAKPDISE